MTNGCSGGAETVHSASPWRPHSLRKGCRSGGSVRPACSVVHRGVDGGSPSGPKVPDERWDVLGPRKIRKGGIRPKVSESVAGEGRAMTYKVLCVFNVKGTKRTCLAGDSPLKEAVPSEAAMPREGHANGSEVSAVKLEQSSAES